MSGERDKPLPLTAYRLPLTILGPMSESSLSDFRAFRERMNDIILNAGNLSR